MSVTEETRFSPMASAMEINLGTPMDRRTDVEVKQTRVAGMLQEAGCDGLLVLAPENFAWLTGGGTARGIVDPDAMPALYYTADARWLVSSNVDSQRIFDEEIDGLGFQLKEWPWHWGRAQLLADLTQGRKIASDEPLEHCQPLGEPFATMRRALSPYEAACYRALGQILSHALEATCRTINRGETEREVAGQLSHRLLHRGCVPVQIAVAADGRSRLYRQPAFTAAPVNQLCVVTATACKYGLCAAASRCRVRRGRPGVPQGARCGVQDQRDLRGQQLARLGTAGDPGQRAAHLPAFRRRRRVFPWSAGARHRSGRCRTELHAAG